MSTITIQDLVYIASAITIFVVAFNHLTSPIKDVKKDISLLKNYASNDYKEINDLKTEIKNHTAHDIEKDIIILSTLQAITRNLITGNNIDQLKDADKQLNDYLIKK